MRRKKLLRANRHGGCAAAGAQVPALVAALDAHARHWRGLLACAFPLRAVLEARPVRVLARREGLQKLTAPLRLLGRQLAQTGASALRALLETTLSLRVGRGRDSPSRSHCAEFVIL